MHQAPPGGRAGGRSRVLGESSGEAAQTRHGGLRQDMGAQQSLACQEPTPGADVFHSPDLCRHYCIAGEMHSLRERFELV